MANTINDENNNIDTDDMAEFDIANEDDNCDDINSVKAIAKRTELEQSIASQKNIWGYSSLGIEAKKAAMTMLSTKTGLYSRIPLICKADSCPYKDQCGLIPYELAPLGEYCPLETSQIEISLNKYIKEFDIRDDDFTDQNILKEIINLEVMTERCKALMAKEQNPIIEVTTGISEQGEEYTHPEVSKAFEIYERCQKQHASLLSLMNATRKDKKGLNISTSNPMSEIIDKIKSIEQNGGFAEPEKPKEIYIVDQYNENK